MKNKDILVFKVSDYSYKASFNNDINNIKMLIGDFELVKIKQSMSRLDMKIYVIPKSKIHKDK